MRKATKKDKEVVVDIISTSFRDNPGVNWLLKNGGANKKAIKRLSALAFIKGLRRNGVFISSNEKGVAICYDPSIKRSSIQEIIYEFYFGITSINLLRIPEVLKRESYRKSKRPSSGNYLYFWFFGVVKGGENAARELGKAVFEEAKQLNLPIYLEAAEKRNKLLYERYGFETYHYWEVPEKNITFWFLRWEPSSSFTA